MKIRRVKLVVFVSVGDEIRSESVIRKSTGLGADRDR